MKKFNHYASSTLIYFLSPQHFEGEKNDEINNKNKFLFVD